MNEISTGMSGREHQLQAQCRQYYDLIDGGICFVLPDETERIVFANETNDQT